MQTRLIAIVAVLVIVLAAAVYFLIGSGGNSASQTSNNSTTTAPILFSATQIAQYSYIISTENLSPEAQAALSGYTVNRVAEPDGSLNVTILINRANMNETVVVKPGYKLYVVETSFGDDPGAFDSSFADDGFVLVDPNGYIV